MIDLKILLALIKKQKEECLLGRNCTNCSKICTLDPRKRYQFRLAVRFKLNVMFKPHVKHLMTL